MAKLVGKIVGKYRVVAKLGKGGMAEVFKAYHPGLDRYVAIKVMHSHLTDDPDFVGRFEREALATAKLRHSNIVQVIDFDREDDLYFMTMEYIDGPTLKSELKIRQKQHNMFSLQDVAIIFNSLCSAIDYAHSKKMVHRDLKPANVMINQEGHIVLTDFGIARIMGGTQYTKTGALSGTPAYMSPEQGRGERGDERSDIYSLGIMLYEIVTGSIPYDADTPFALIMKHINQPLPLPTKVNPDIPKEVENVILKAMSKEPDERYQKAGELSKALRDSVGIGTGVNLQNLSLTVIASSPQIDQIDHSTGPLTQQERKSKTFLTVDNSHTISSSGQVDKTIRSQAPSIATPSKNMPILLAIIGLFALIAAIAFGGFFLTRNSVNLEETATAITVRDTATAAANATGVAANIVDSAVTGQAIIKQTATAFVVAIEQTTVAQTAQVEIVTTALANQAATTIAIAMKELATAKKAIANAIASRTATLIATKTPLPTATRRPPTNTPTPAPPTSTPTPEKPDITGKLAFPVDDGAGKYDVYIVSMPNGSQLGIIKGARQPNFRSDGIKLLVNGHGGSFGEDVFEAAANGNIERAVSGSPTDMYPVYNPEGNRIAYSNPQLSLGTDGSYHSYLFVQCGIIPPNEEGDQTCQDIARFGILVPNGQIGEVQGSHSLWTADDRILYKGCNSWKGGGSCGIFISVSWGNKRGGNGSDPVKIGNGSSLVPTDTYGNFVAYQSHESGSWEAYVMGLDGAGVVNLSNSPGSDDGLPTISPDGQWVAFASNREGGWAVFAVPINGGTVVKLFNFPKANPWATGDRDWSTERMSWSK